MACHKSLLCLHTYVFLEIQWTEPGSNRRPKDFQSFALPAELSVLPSFAPTAPILPPARIGATLRHRRQDLGWKCSSIQAILHIVPSVGTYLSGHVGQQQERRHRSSGSGPWRKPSSGLSFDLPMASQGRSASSAVTRTPWTLTTAEQPERDIP